STLTFAARGLSPWFCWRRETVGASFIPGVVGVTAWPVVAWRQQLPVPVVSYLQFGAIRAGGWIGLGDMSTAIFFASGSIVWRSSTDLAVMSLDTLAKPVMFLRDGQDF